MLSTKYQYNIETNKNIHKEANILFEMSKFHASITKDETPKKIIKQKLQIQIKYCLALFLI